MRRTRAIGTVAALAAAACTTIAGDFDRIIAIEIPDQGTRSVEEGDTLTLTAAALDARGDTVPDAQIRWQIVDPDTAGQIGFTLDSVTGLVTGIFPSTARVQASVENLRTAPFPVTVTAAPDSAAAPGEIVVMASKTDVQSPALQVQVLDTTTDPVNPAGLPAKTVMYNLADGGDSRYFLSAGDSVPVGDGSSIEVPTSGAGIAVAVVRIASGATPPDTVIVDATVRRRSGQEVAGSPLRFTVLFLSTQ